MRQMVSAGISRAGRNGIVHVEKNGWLLLDRVAGRGQAGRGHGQNKIQVLIVVILQEGRNVGDLSLRVRTLHFEVVALLKSQFPQPVEEALHADFRARFRRKVDQAHFELPSGRRPPQFGDGFIPQSFFVEPDLGAPQHTSELAAPSTPDELSTLASSSSIPISRQTFRATRVNASELDSAEFQANPTDLSPGNMARAI